MTFVAALAVDAAVDELAEHCRRVGTEQPVSFVRHDAVAVAWDAGCPWITTSDDGEVLILVDGRLHNLSPSAADQADLLLERYREVGVDVARGLLGDFVLIVVDRRSGTTLVARDPLGVRPWYGATQGSRHAGASNLATLAALPSVDLAVNDRIAIEYLAAIEQSRGETLYRGIRSLRPGETWHWRSGRSSTFAHHRWEIEPELGISWDDAAARCRETLSEAVRCRLDAGGPATSELSGGLDSSIVAGTAVLLGRADLVVGRLLFDTARADERAYSDAVADHWGLRVVSAPPWIPSQEELEDLAAELRRPAPDANFTMFSDLHRRLAADGRRDLLTGLGGDDAFIAMGTASQVVSALQLRRPRALSELVRATGNGARGAWRHLIRPTLGHFASPRRGHGLPAWVSDFAVEQAELRARLRRRPAKVTGVDAIDERLWPLTSGYDAAILEIRAALGDRIGRRESHPFLDPRFVACTYGLDPAWPGRDGHSRALEVDAFCDRLPAVVAQRRSKAEFSEIFWPQVLQDAILDRVRDGPLRERGWLETTGFEALVQDAKGGMANAAIPLSRCLALDRWMRVQR